MKVEIKRKEGLLNKIVRIIFNKKLLKNKIYSVALISIGYLSIKLLEGDCTVFLLMLMFGLPVFFADENVIV